MCHHLEAAFRIFRKNGSLYNAEDAKIMFAKISSLLQLEIILFNINLIYLVDLLSNLRKQHI